MGNISKFKILSQAKEDFSKSDYDNALKKFAEVLQNFPNSKEAYNYTILSDMAISGESGAEALFDYYEILIDENKEQADEIMGNILNNMDGALEKLNTIFADPIKEKLEFEDGILYQDFLDIVKKEDNFKEIFENIMFSTRVIITSKEDFLDFLDKLIEHNFSDMAMHYLETALSTYSGDSSLNSLLKKILDKEDQKIEDWTT